MQKYWWTGVTIAHRGNSYSIVYIHTSTELCQIIEEDYLSYALLISRVGAKNKKRDPRIIGLSRSFSTRIKLIQIMPLLPYLQHLPNSAGPRFYTLVFPVLISRQILLSRFLPPTIQEKKKKMIMRRAVLISFCFSYRTTRGLLMRHSRTIRNCPSLLV